MDKVCDRIPMNSLNRGWKVLIMGLGALGLVLMSGFVPAQAQGPDPTLLPVATIDQKPCVGTPLPASCNNTAYDATAVFALSAGQSYADPTTGVTVYKLTSGSYPASAGSWGHDYAEGGAEVSLPHTGNTRTIKVFDWNGNNHWLIDFTPGATPALTNARQLTGNLAPNADIAFAFSLNPTTPYYAFVAGGGAIRRFDVRTMAEVPGNGWPVTTTLNKQIQWLTQSENDTLFAWLDSGTSNMTAYEPSTGTKKTATFATGHQVQVDKGGRYIFWSLDGNAGVIWDFTSGPNGATLWNVAGDPGIPFAHTAMLRRRIMVTNWNVSAPYNFAYLIVDQQRARAPLPMPIRTAGGSRTRRISETNGRW